jgi:hypothetical protein
VRFRSKSFRFRFPEKFRSFQNSAREINKQSGSEIGKRNFVLPSGCAFIESSLLSRQRLTLTTLQRLNEAYPDHSFHSLVVRHGTNPPWRTWRLRSVGAEAV